MYNTLTCRRTKKRVLRLNTPDLGSRGLRIMISLSAPSRPSESEGGMSAKMLAQRSIMAWNGRGMLRLRRVRV